MEKRVNIPSEQVSTFLKLVDSSVEEFNRISELCKSFPKGAKSSDLKKYLEEKVEYSDVVLGILTGFITFGMDPKYFINALYKSYLDKLDEKDVKISEKEFNQKFSLLFQSNNPVLISLVERVSKTLFEKVIIDKKILTDIRPLFVNDGNLGILDGSIIVNQLRILYDEGDSLKEIYFYLDKDDLSELRDSIDVALKRIEELEKNLEASILRPLK